MRRLVLFYFFLLLAMGACSQRAERHPDPVVKKEFGPSIEDKKLDLNETVPLSPAHLVSGRDVIMDSKDWLELSDALFETAETLPEAPSRKLQGQGHRLLRKFYEFDGTTTAMTAASQPAGNPYTEMAYSYAQKALIKKFLDT